MSPNAQVSAPSFLLTFALTQSASELLWPRNREHIDSDSKHGFAIINTLENFTSWAMLDEKLYLNLATLHKLKLNERRILSTIRKSNIFSKFTIAMLRKLGNNKERTMALQLMERVESLLWLRQDKLLGKWVGYEDLFMSKDGLLIIQQELIYKPEQLLRSFDQVSPYSTKNMFGLFNCFEMSVFALFRHKFALAVEWIEASVPTYKETSKLDNHLIQLYSKITKQRHNIAFLNNKLGVRPQNTRIPFFETFTEPVLPTSKRGKYITELVFDQIKAATGISASAQRHGQLCRGENLQSAQEQANLKCYYVTNGQPYLFIGPVKVEHLSHFPPVIQYYNVIGNRTIDKIHQQMTPTLYHIYKIREIFKEQKVNSVINLLGINEIPESIWSLLYAATGFDAKSSHFDLHYAVYTPGRWHYGHKDQHGGNFIDHEDVITLGDRIATLVLYLEIADSGGQTAFARAGTTDRQVRASAVLFIGQYTNGTIRQDGHHEGCAVVSGQKIIVTIFMHYFANWKTFPCSTNQYDETSKPKIVTFWGQNERN